MSDPQDTPDEYQSKLKKKVARIFGIIGIVFGLLLILGGSRDYLFPRHTLEHSAYGEISGVVSEKPESHSPGRGQYINFRVREYPAADFRISGLSLKAASAGIIGRIDTGDTVTITISKDDSNLTVNNKGTQVVQVYGLAEKDTKFLALDNYKAAMTRDNKLGWIGILVGLMLIAYYSYVLYKSKKIRS